MIDRKLFGKILKKARMQLGISKCRLAKEVPLCYATINNLEHNRFCPCYITLEKLINYFKKKGIDLEKI